MTDQERTTGFYDVQHHGGAQFGSALGWRWATTFGDVVGEHAAVRTDVGVWDGSPHTKWRLHGPDTRAALNRVFTRDFGSTEIGQVRYCPFCDADGKMLGDATVFVFADDRCWIVTAPSTEADEEHFRSVIDGLRVSLELATDDLPQLGINGPRAQQVLMSVCDADVAALGYFRFFPERIRVGGVRCWLSRTGYSGELGYELFCDPGECDALWEVVTGAGARPYGLDATEVIRIESGLLAFGADFFPHQTSPYDVSLDRLVDLTKDDFCGKAALQRAAANPRNQLVTLVVDGPVPAYGAEVTKEGERVGTLTSPCDSLTLGQVIGLATILRELAEVGMHLNVAVEGGISTATVAPVPIYDPEKKHPRGDYD